MKIVMINYIYNIQLLFPLTVHITFIISVKIMAMIVLPYRAALIVLLNLEDLLELYK